MLSINEEHIEFVKNAFFTIEKKEINGIVGYYLIVSIDFYNKNLPGYLDLSAGWEDESDIHLFLNRKYYGNPFGGGSIGFFEIYNNKKLYSKKIKNKIYLNLSEIENNKIKAKISLKDKLIELDYDGYLEYL